MSRSGWILLAVVLAGCSPGPTDACGKVCSARQGTTSGPVDAEGGPLSASCPVGYTCDAMTSSCVANDGHCTSAIDGGGGAATGTSGGTTS